MSFSNGSVEFGHQAQPRPNAEAEAKHEEQLEALRDEQDGGGTGVVTLHAGPLKTVPSGSGTQTQELLTQAPWPEQKFPSLRHGGVVTVHVYISLPGHVE